jgi:Restriction endonuclease
MMDSAAGSGFSLLNLLRKKSRTPEAASRMLLAAAAELGLSPGEEISPLCAAYALLKLEKGVEEVSRMLDWRDFERLSAALMRSAGYSVDFDVTLRKPRAQIDIVAYGTSMILCVDCKHWQRKLARSALAKIAEDQLRRSALLRAREDDPRPILSVILTLSEPEGTFVQGVPVVPVRTLSSFLGSLEAYSEFVEFR